MPNLPNRPNTMTPRYPIEPLAKHLGITLGQIGGHQPGDHPTGITALAEALNLSPSRIYHYRRHGLTEATTTTLTNTLTPQETAA